MFISFRSAVAASQARFMGVFKGKIPNGEGLKLRVARLNAALMLVVKLRRQVAIFAAAGPGAVTTTRGARRLNVIVAAVALVA